MKTGLLSAVNDIPEYVRRKTIPVLGKIVSAINESTGSKLYVRAHTTDSQFVGRVPKGEEAFEQDLAEMGFERNPFASLKQRLGTRETEEGSFRYYKPNSDYQLHVIIYDGSVVPNAQSGETYIYAHYEYRWDMYPIKHYKGVNYQVKRGVEMMREMLDEHSIGYDDKRP